MKKITGVLMCVPLIFSVVHAGEAGYIDQTFARLNYLTGDTYVQRATDLGYEAGIINMPITQGDRISTEGGRAEIYLGVGTYIRLDYRTNLDILDLPRRISGVTRLRLWDGNMYLSVRRLEEDKPIEIHTSDVSLYILDRGLYRIDVRENRETAIFVFRGMAEAAGDGRSSLLKSGQRLEAARGQFISSPAPFSAAAIDSFDRWSGIREDLLRRRLARAYLPGELEDFEYELADHGRWHYVFPYGYVWVPGGMSRSWRPYRHGRWAWYSSCEWTWIPYESWGWVTCHYGRWHWRLDLGWYWIPTTRWGPAWVSWYVGADYCGWAPLTYYGRPALIINNHFYADYSDPGYPSESAAMTMVAKNQLSAPDISRVAVSKESLSSRTSRVRMSGSAPRPGNMEPQMKVHSSEEGARLIRRPVSEKAPQSPSESNLKSGAVDRIPSRSSGSKKNMTVTPRSDTAGKSKDAQARKTPVKEPDRGAKSESPPVRTTEKSASPSGSISRPAKSETAASKSSSSRSAATSGSTGSASKSGSDTSKKSSSTAQNSGAKTTRSKKSKKK